MSTKENKQAQEDILKEQSEQTVDNTQTGTSEEEAVQASEAEEQIESEEAQELTAEEKLEKELETVKKLVEEQKDKYLRLSAEFDNYRKRTLKEKAELIKNGGEKAITSILPILDDLERALQNMQKTEDVKAIYDGVDLIYQKFLKELSHEGLKKMEPIGEAFDTDYHEAIALVPSPSEEQKGKVLDCVQTGYTLNDKVIRHAKVVVAQ
ncbi:nucleotide exchange factor GrpE [Phocaeicola barnesiae]